MCADRLTSAQRMRALAAKQGLDRVPVIPMASAYTAVISGLTLKEYYLEPEKALWAQEWAADLHRYDGSPSFNIPDWAGWDFGGELTFPSSPRIALPYLGKRAVTIASDVEKLSLPDIKSAPAAGRLLSFARLAREKGYPVSVPGGSPMGIAGSAIGPEKMMRWFYKEPEAVHRMLRLSTDYIISIASLFAGEFGADNCSAFATYPLEAHAVVSPKIFEKFSLPYVNEIHEKLIDMGIKRWVIHLCGDHTKNLYLWKKDIKLAPRTVFTVGHEMDLAYTAEYLGEDYIIGGNIPTTFLQTATPDEVLEVSRQTIERMKHSPGGFILTPACALPPITPPANLHAMVKAVRLFGVFS